jgi:hypothetical protein
MCRPLCRMFDQCFPARRKEGFAYSRNNVVRSGLKPILRKLESLTKT